MKFGYTIAYVSDVAATLAFYERAFGLRRRFLHESGLYGELETGATTLAFAAESMAESHGLVIRPNRADTPSAGFELAWLTDDPVQAYAAALAAGAQAISPPAVKPWGQTVAYLKDPNGLLIELCSVVDAGGTATVAD